jgi:hypothetical protein
MKFVNDDIMEGVRREIVEAVFPCQCLHYRETALPSCVRPLPLVRKMEKDLKADIEIARTRKCQL